MPAKILESQLVISGKDATGDLFQKVGGKIDRLAAAGKRIDGLGGSFNRMGGQVAGAGRHIDNLHSRMRALQGTSAQLAKALAPIGGMMAAYEASRLGRAALEKTAAAVGAGAHEGVRMEAAGMSPTEITEANARAAELSARYTSISQTTVEHLLRNVRSVVGSFEEAVHILDPFLKLYTVVQGAHPERAEELAEDFDKLIKAFEMKGVTMHPEQFLDYMQGMAKALNVFGDTLRPTDFYEMFKYGRGATIGLSREFMLKTAPTLAQEIGGKSAGEMLASFHQQFVAGKMSKQAFKALQKMGLIEKSKVIETALGFEGVRVKGADIARSDPYAWVNQVLLPALAAKGITSPEAIQDVLNQLASRRTGGQMLSIFGSQQARIEKDWALVRDALGLEASDVFQKKDPFLARRALIEQMQNLLRQAGSPLAQPGVDVMNLTAGGLSGLTEWARKHPALGAGSLAIGGGATLGLTTYEGALAGLWFSGFMSGQTAKGLAAMPFRALSFLSRVGGPWVTPAIAGYQLYDIFSDPKSYVGKKVTDMSEADLDRMAESFFGAAAWRGAKPGGEATLEVKISPSPEFEARLDRIENAAGLRINGKSGYPASALGKSMREAVPGSEW